MMKTILLLALPLLMFCSAIKVRGQAEIQIIHNSGDSSITTVDIWADNNMLYDNLIFRASSQFLLIPAGSTDISIAASNSTDTVNAVFRKNFNFISGEKYITILNGIVSSSGYNPLTPFDIHSFAMARDSATSSGNIDVLFFHGVTDEVMVDVLDGSSGTYFDDISYASFGPYISRPTSDLMLNVVDAGGQNLINGYLLPAATFGFVDLAVTVVFSGFADQSVNSNSPAAAGLWMALPVGGGLIDLPVVVTDIEEQDAQLQNLSIYPNPANKDLFLNLSLTEAQNARVEIYDMIGARVFVKDLHRLPKGNNRVEISTVDMKEGIYFCRITCGIEVETRKLEIKH